MHSQNISLSRNVWSRGPQVRQTESFVHPPYLHIYLASHRSCSTSSTSVAARSRSPLATNNVSRLTMDVSVRGCRFPSVSRIPPTPSRSSISGITPRIASRFAFRFASSIASCAAPRTAARVFLPVAVSSPQLIGSAPAPPAPPGPVGPPLTGPALDRRYLPDKHLQSRSRMRPPERRLVDAVGQRGGDGYRRAVAALHPGSEATEVGLESQTRRSGEEYTRLSLKKRCTHF